MHGNEATAGRSRGGGGTNGSRAQVEWEALSAVYWRPQIALVVSADQCDEQSAYEVSHLGIDRKFGSAVGVVPVHCEAEWVVHEQGFVQSVVSDRRYSGCSPISLRGLGPGWYLDAQFLAHPLDPLTMGETTLEVPEVCRQFVARVNRRVEVDEPLELQSLRILAEKQGMNRRLEALGLRVSGGFSLQNESASSSTRIRLWPTKTKSTSIPLRIGVASRKPASVVVSRMPTKNDRTHTMKSRWSSSVASWCSIRCVLGNGNAREGYGSSRVPPVKDSRDCRRGG